MTRKERTVRTLPPPQLSNERSRFRSGRRERGEAGAVATGKSCDDRQDSVQAAPAGQGHEYPARADGEEMIHAPSVEIVAKVKCRDANSLSAEGSYCRAQE